MADRSPYTIATTDGNREGLGISIDALANVEAKAAAERKKNRKPKEVLAFDRPVTEKELNNLPLLANELRQLDFRLDDTLRRIKNVDEEYKEVNSKQLKLQGSIKALSSSHEPRILEKVKELQDESQKLASYLTKLDSFLVGLNKIVAVTREQREKWMQTTGKRFNYLLSVQQQIDGKVSQTGPGSNQQRFQHEGDAKKEFENPTVL